MKTTREKMGITEDGEITVLRRIRDLEEECETRDLQKKLEVYESLVGEEQ